MSDKSPKSAAGTKKSGRFTRFLVKLAIAFAAVATVGAVSQLPSRKQEVPVTDPPPVRVTAITVAAEPEIADTIELPGTTDRLPDQFAKLLFEMSSPLTPFMIGRAKELGMPAEDGARGFVFNAQPMQVIQFLDIGTRPANLR